MKKILIVDDEADLCFLLKKNIEFQGSFEVQTCSDSRHAIFKAAEIQPDLVILDIMMPKVSGIEIAQQLHTHPRFRNCPIIFLTGIASEQEVENRKRIMGDGKFYMISKPIETVELIRIINSVLAGKEPSLPPLPQAPWRKIEI